MRGRGSTPIIIWPPIISLYHLVPLDSLALVSHFPNLFSHHFGEAPDLDEVGVVTAFMDQIEGNILPVMVPNGQVAVGGGIRTNRKLCATL